MLVTFSNRLSGDITMFGDIAVQLLKLMGHSGTVPSALNAEDVPTALANLQNALAYQRMMRHKMKKSRGLLSVLRIEQCL